MKLVAQGKERLGLLLVGHGTRSSRGQQEFLQTAKLVAGLDPSALVEPCFLELAEPGIESGVFSLARRGATRLTVAPLLLFAAGHAKHDIPRAVQRAIKSTRFQTFAYAETLGCHPKLLEMSRQQHRAAVAGRPVVSAQATVSLLVGRGSSDPDAVNQLRQFARSRAMTDLSSRTEIAFMAKADPSLKDILADISVAAPRRVVVQPHLLFFGEVLASLNEQIAHAVIAQSDTEWLLCEHLGPSIPVAEVVMERCQQPTSTKQVTTIQAGS